MHYQETSEEADFRKRARTWLEENVPTTARPHDAAAAREYDLTWQRRQYEGGWAGINWPTEHGGLGLDLTLQIIWVQECVRANAPGPGCLVGGLNHAMPTLMQYGTPEQQAAHIQRVLVGDEVWCQGFSEPGAGSDLAAIATRGVVDGDHLVVTGQKVWTSFANLADFQELLVRTDPDAPKHRGISWVICDMRSPGVEVRPIKLMSGDDHFAEVFYDQVHIPLTNVVGGLNNGWKVAMTTLNFERGTAFMADQLRLSKLAAELVDLAHRAPSPSGRGLAIDDGQIRAELARAVSGSRSLEAMTNRLTSPRMAATGSGAESSLLRIQFSAVAQSMYRLAQRLRGGDSLIDDLDLDEASWLHQYLWSYQTSIGGGTREIQHNIVGDRHLHLPR